MPSQPLFSVTDWEALTQLPWWMFVLLLLSGNAITGAASFPVILKWVRNARRVAGYYILAMKSIADSNAEKLEMRQVNLKLQKEVVELERKDEDKQKKIETLTDRVKCLEDEIRKKRKRGGKGPGDGSGEHLPLP